MLEKLTGASIRVQHFYFSVFLTCGSVALFLIYHHLKIENIYSLPERAGNVVKEESLKNISDFFKEVYKVSAKCQNLHSLGKPSAFGDTWKLVCYDDDVIPPKNSCLVYSFGVGPDFSFDIDMVNVFGCQVHMFDPTVNVTKDKLIKNLYFYPIGISSRDTDIEIKQSDIYDYPIMYGEFTTFQKIRKKLGHENRTIDYLKLDVEGAEFEIFADLLRNPDSLSGVKQISVEFHANELLRVKPKGGLKLANYYYKILKGLEKLGYQKIPSSINPDGVMRFLSSQVDVHYIYRPNHLSWAPYS